MPALRIEERAIGIGLIPCLDVVAVDLPAHYDVLRRDRRLVRQAPAVADNGLPVVAGEQPEVEGLERAFAEATLARREQHLRARQRYAEAHGASAAIRTANATSSSWPPISPSSLRLSVSRSARPIAGPSGTPAARRSSPVISSPVPLRCSR